MANDFQYVVRQHYSEATEERLKKTLTAMDLAEMVDIPDGTTKNIPHVKMRATGNYTKYTDQTITDVKTGNDTIVIDTTPMVNFAIDMLDEEDNYINVKPEVISDASYQIKQRIDGDFFNKVTDAKWKYDANGFGVNAGTLSPITLATGASQNISATFGKAKAGLTNSGVNGEKLVLAIDDNVAVDLATLGLEQGYNIADESYTRGYVGRFWGLRTYQVSTLTSTTVLDLATNPTNGDYIYIKGVKFTFVSSIGTTAGNVLIGASADATAVNLIALITTPWTTTANGVALADDDIAILEGVSAVDGTDLVTFTSKNGALLASSSMTAAANDFRAQVLNATIMERGAIKMAFRGVKTDSRDETKKLVTNYFIYARYGLKVTTRAKEKMCIIPLVSQAAES